MRPVIVVHGIFDPAYRVLPLVRALRARGLSPVRRARLPALGTVRIELLAQLLSDLVEQKLEEHRAHEVDIVGYSMGALVTRAYLQLLGGDRYVKTFVSISGPHRGTLTAYALPFAGIQQMRPDSELLRTLGHDVSHLQHTRVHCLYTPYDALILPATSGVLDGAASVHRLPVPAHHRMLRDARVHDLIAALLHEDHASGLARGSRQQEKS